MAPLARQGELAPKVTEGLSPVPPLIGKIPRLPCPRRVSAANLKVERFWSKEYCVLFAENKPTVTPERPEGAFRCEGGSRPPQAD